MDGEATLRIFGTIDVVMAALAAELQLVVAPPPNFAARTAEQFEVPFGSDGLRLPAGAPRRGLDLREGGRVRITAGPFEGDEGEVIGRSRTGHFNIRSAHRYAML